MKKLYDKDGNYVMSIVDESVQPDMESKRFLNKIKQIFKTTPERLIEFDEVWLDNAALFGVVNRKHEDMLLATILAEVGEDLISKRENLNYTSQSLRNTFNRYKNNPNWSKRDGRTDAQKANQVNIGNVAYADRLGNGNIDSGDGYKFRGGGYIQTTGRYNWTKSAQTIQMLTDTSIGAENLEGASNTIAGGLLMTFAFFFDNNMEECNTMDECTDKVNKYTESREQRNESYEWISGL